jgi:nitronate monooxygenase
MDQRGATVTFSLNDLPEPIVLAPLAGGPSTPALAAEVSRAGGLGFLGSGYKTADAARKDVEAVRAATSRPIGLNIFIPPPVEVDGARVRAYAERVRIEAERFGAEVGEARWSDDDWAAKLDMVAEERVPVVSFTFGCPPADVVSRLQESGSAVWVTVTDPREAEQAARAGASALVVQGIEAGGHRGSFVDRDGAGDIGLLALLRLVRRAVDLPLVATGGIVDGAGIAAVLTAGASAAQLGSAFMRAAEAGTSGAHRQALAASAPTTLTRAFTGRAARGIVNRFLREHSAHAPIAYPYVNGLTSPMRAAARQRGEPDLINLWAGQAYTLAHEAPAAELMAELSRGWRQALEDASHRLSRA